MPDSNVHTAEESRVQKFAAMGQDLGEIYSALWQQLTWLYQKWGQFADAFGTSPEHIKIFNDAAPDFFGTIQDSLWENVSCISPDSLIRQKLPGRRISHSANCALSFMASRYAPM
jgi:hypothetical protein